MPTLRPAWAASRIRGWRWQTLGMVVVAALFVALAGQAQAVSVDSPEVKKCVEKAVKYLETQASDKLGGNCLIALALYKNNYKIDHPRIKAALDACKSATPKNNTIIDNYSLGCAVIFLCEVDPQGNRAVIEKYLDEIYARQRPAGGWGYPMQTTGDTSQTQYPVLAIWMAQQHGFEVPQKVIEGAALWLLRTQDPSGGFGYQGNDPGNFNRVKQSEIRQSLTAAGLGSLLAISDLIHIKGLGERRKDSKLPPALRVVDEEKEKGRKRATSIDPTIYNRAIDDGNRWFDQHFKVKVDNWNFYYYYAYERYRSFRELAESNFSEEPEWFTKIFEHLQSTQQPDGHWEPSGVGPQVDTAFAVLFLSRSTRKSIEERGRDLGEGILKGGMGLPPKTADLREKNGRLIDSTLFGSVDELLSLADEKDNPELAALLQTSADLKFDKDVTKRSGQIEQLRSLVRAESFEARLLAVKTLGKDRDLDNAPVLIFALTDPDIRVVLEADRALRALSRKVDGVGLEPGATREQIAEAKKAWTAWLVSIRPDAQLLD